MFYTILIGVIAYSLTALLGYVIHWTIHQPWAGALYRAHHAHHTSLYPKTDLISERYRSAGSQSTVWTFILAFTPFLAMPPLLAAVGWIYWGQAVVAILSMGVVGILNDVFHDSFHIKRHWLRKVPGYNKMQRRHFLHHVNMRCNFGIYGFGWDWFFGSLRQ